MANKDVQIQIDTTELRELLDKIRKAEEPVSVLSCYAIGTENTGNKTKEGFLIYKLTLRKIVGALR